MSQTEIETAVPLAEESPSQQIDLPLPIPTPSPKKSRDMTKSEWREISMDIQVILKGFPEKIRVPTGLIQPFQNETSLEKVHILLPDSAALDLIYAHLSKRTDTIITEMVVRPTDISLIYKSKFKVFLEKSKGIHFNLGRYLLDFGRAGDLLKKVFSSLHEDLELNENGLILKSKEGDIEDILVLTSGFSTILSLIGLDSSSYNYASQSRQMLLEYILGSPYVNYTSLQEVSLEETSKDSPFLLGVKEGIDEYLLNPLSPRNTYTMGDKGKQEVLSGILRATIGIVSYKVFIKNLQQTNLQTQIASKVSIGKAIGDKINIYDSKELQSFMKYINIIMHKDNLPSGRFEKKGIPASEVSISKYISDAFETWEKVNKKQGL